MDISRLVVCSEFLERVHSDLCHICLKPRSAHPGDADRQYWAQWVVAEVLLELHPWQPFHGADRQPV